MQIFKSAPDLSTYLKSNKKVASSIGFIPTMGALHSGHISLLNTSKNENDISIASIFVNPIQFNNPSDLQRYPRPIEEDIQLLQNAGCDILFLPDEQEMYTDPPKTTFSFGYLDQVLEAAFRPGHFSGVGIVVSKLFNIVKPDRAYFGQKDLQQLAVIRQMVKDLSFPIKIIPCPIIREKDGLAMSSRNRRIPEKSRPSANKIYAALQLAHRALLLHSIDDIKNQVNVFFLKFPDLKLEYFEIVDNETFVEVKNVEDHKSIALCIAAYLNDVRLIDNIVIDQPSTAH